MNVALMEFNPLEGIPNGKDIHYKCAVCNDIVQSVTSHSAYCSCRNIFKDVDAGRVSIKDCKKVYLFKRIP